MIEDQCPRKNVAVVPFVLRIELPCDRFREGVEVLSQILNTFATTLNEKRKQTSTPLQTALSLHCQKKKTTKDLDMSLFAFSFTYELVS
jgi:hypothetical protein